jgi:hypothetical protein
MKTFRRNKSKKSLAATVIGDYLKIRAAGKAAKGAGKAVKSTALVKTQKRSKLKPLAIVGAVGAAAAGLAAVRRRSGNTAAA